MSRSIFITHVELFSQFIKIHGQTNRESAIRIEFGMTTTLNLFQSYPPPLLNMLDANSIVLISHKSKYYRGKFLSANADKTVNVLLIDMGNQITVDLKDIRVLSVCPKASEYVIGQPPQASEFLLNRCVITRDSNLNKIKDEILLQDMPYVIEDEIDNLKLLSLHLNGINYVDSLRDTIGCNIITKEQFKSYFSQKMHPTAPRPGNQILRKPNNLTDSGSLPLRSSINSTGKQLINHYLGKNPQVPQNMPSYQPRISPSMDYNSNQNALNQPQPLNKSAESVNSYHIPTFVSDTLIIGGHHQVYVSHVEDGPYMFSVQLKTYEQKMDDMMAAITKCKLQQLSRKPTLGMACIARYSVDNNLYRAVIKSIHSDSCQLLYVDYGNSEKVLYSDIYDIPEEFLRQKTFAIRVTLAGLKSLPNLSEQQKTVFADMVTDKTFDMLVVKPDDKAFVQYCELTVDGDSVLKQILHICLGKSKFNEPTPLSENDFVVIRYVESPKLFCVQQTKNIVEYNAMMDRLHQYCMTAPQLSNLDVGIACAARFKNDEEWYRAEIVKVSGNKALIRFIDFGIEFQTEVNKLKVIGYEFLAMPKQAVLCCLFGFDLMQTLSNSSQEKMELLAEDSLGERRNFKVKILGNVNDAVLVNLIDESQVPHLDLSIRMLQLSLPQKSFRQYELQMMNENPSARQTNTQMINQNTDRIANATSSLKAMSDSGFQEYGANSSGIISNWDTSKKSEDTPSSGLGSSESSPMKQDVFAPRDSKFIKSTHYANPTYDHRTNRSIASNTSSISRREQQEPEEIIDPHTQIPYTNIAINSVSEVTFTMWFSPLEFYVSTKESDSDLDYTMQMKNIHHFYKDKTPEIKKFPIGSFAIVKYSKTNQLHRAKLIDFNVKLNKYKAQLIDLGALTIVDATDIYGMDKRFAKLPRQAIQCSLSGVAIQACRFDIEGAVDEYIGTNTIYCKFIKRKADMFYVDIETDRWNVRESLIRREYLSILKEDIEIERLVGQTLMARFVSIKDESSFRILLFGCETIFEASCKDGKTSKKSNDFKKLPLGQTISMRIDSLLVGRTFAVTPLIEFFGETPPSAICRFPVFSNNFVAAIMHWESYNVVYIQNEEVAYLVQSLLNDLFEYYEGNGEILNDFIPNTLCAVKSGDGNWYRAKIISEADTEVYVNYIDYGNSESIPRETVKHLESQFLRTPALAIKVYLSIKGMHKEKKSVLDDISNLTKELLFDLKVIEFYSENWIVDMFNKTTNIMSVIQTKMFCEKISIDEIRKQIDFTETLKKNEELTLQNQQSAINRHQRTKQLNSVLPQSVQPISSGHGIQSAALQTTAVKSMAAKPTNVQPAVVQPSIVQPSIVQPSVVQPSVQSAIAQQAVAQPAAARSATARPNAARPSVARPSVAQPAVAQSAVAQPAVAQPAVAQSAVAQPAVAQPAVARPAVARPAVARPTVARPTVARPTVALSTVTQSPIARPSVPPSTVQPIVAQPTVQNTQTTSQIATKPTAYISHIDRPDRFYLQIASKSADLDELQTNIQIVAQSLPPLEDFSIGTRCIVRYSVDEQWYRAAIIDSDTKITSILFIDYGNTDTITDNNLIKSMNDAFDLIPAFAIPCALPLEAKDRNEWSEESCELLKQLINDDIEFEYVCKGKCNNFVKIYLGDRDIMQELIGKGYAIKLDTIKSGGNCFVSHMNSISDFYIQMESDDDALKIVEAYLSDESKFPVMTDIKDGIVCAAKFLDDGLWYRAKIKSHTADNTEVFFIDYGNSSSTNELRIIPTEIANGPMLSKYCSMVKPKDVQYWSEEAEKRFAELTDNGTVFTVDVISPGKQSIVDLAVNEKSILEELANLCDKFSVSALENILQSNNVVEPENFTAFIVEGTPDRFYVQLESSTAQLERMCQLMESASEWPLLEETIVGQMCAALFVGCYYRAKIVALSDKGVTVHFIDYGNDSITTDLRKIPDNIRNMQQLSILCSLGYKNQVFSPDLIQRFQNLSKENPFEMKYISKTASPAVVQLFENGVLFEEKPQEAINKIMKPTESSDCGRINAYISENVSPNRFYIQLNDMVEEMSNASDFPLLDDSDKFVGKLCAAYWDAGFYRAQILAVDDLGIKVEFIDYGYESYVKDVRKLPVDIERKERGAMLCSLERKGSSFSKSFIEMFANLDLNKEFEFEILSRTNQLTVVRLYEDGKLLVDAMEPISSNLNETENGSNSIGNGIIGSVITGAEVEQIANEITTRT